MEEIAAEIKEETAKIKSFYRENGLVRDRRNKDEKNMLQDATNRGATSNKLWNTSHFMVAILINNGLYTTKDIKRNDSEQSRILPRPAIKNKYDKTHKPIRYESKKQAARVLIYQTCIVLRSTNRKISLLRVKRFEIFNPQRPGRLLRRN